MDLSQLPPREALTNSSLTFSRPRGRNIIARTEPFFAWQQTRRENGCWPFSTVLGRAPAPETVVATETGKPRSGINFASQDYLALTSHPQVHEVVLRALRDFGPHSAGSAVLQGNTLLSLDLERALSEHLQMEHVLLFPTGWGAGFGAINGLVRPDDWIVMDVFTHACIQSGAMASTQKIIRHDHLRTDQIRELLRDLRAKDANNGILVVTEGLFSMDADIPAIAPIIEACREYDATLMVDIAHDYGAMGPNGTGALGMQGLLGQVDIVMGSFSKTFASNGGFVATNSAAARHFLKTFGGPHIFSNALSPIQAAVVKACLDIVRSPEGDCLRASLLETIGTLRDSLGARGITCAGDPSPIVPAMVGREDVARLTARLLSEQALFANLVEYPAVPVGTARFRFQVMASHSHEHVRKAVEIFAAAISEARNMI